MQFYMFLMVVSIGKLCYLHWTDKCSDLIYCYLNASFAVHTGLLQVSWWMFEHACSFLMLLLLLLFLLLFLFLILIFCSLIFVRWFHCTTEHSSVCLGFVLQFAVMFLLLLYWKCFMQHICHDQLCYFLWFI